MVDKRPQLAIFDVYGTLLDVDGPMRAQSGRLGSDWQQISAEWRAKHIEYPGSEHWPALGITGISGSSPANPFRSSRSGTASPTRSC